MTTTPDGPRPPRVDPRAVVSPEAVLGEGVEVGPFAIVEAGVVVGAGTRIWAHAYLCAGTTLGRDNVVHMGAVLGHEPQDRAYDGAPTGLVIGDRNVFREGVQVHRGTAAGSETVIGSDCYLMTNSHVAHNCRLEDGVIMATGAVLGGHASVGERAFVSGNALVHQHTRVGRLAMLQGGCAVSKDVPPFCTTRIGKNTIAGVNVVGLRRAGLPRDRVVAIRRAFRTLFLGRPNLSLARERLLAQESERGGPVPEVREMLDFIAAARHGVCAGPRKGGVEDEDDE
ncbi:MAG: acyl-ACP--UDP-N-acetylglucosamine O-acyltransferase [Thermodesulfobacteriota bacterium]